MSDYESIVLFYIKSFSRVNLRVILPVPDSVIESAAFLNTSLDNSKFRLQFGLTPIYLNIGINEQATIAEKYVELEAISIRLTKIVHTLRHNNFNKFDYLYQIGERRLTRAHQYGRS